MSNPSVTAVINVQDNASPAMKELLVLSKRIAEETAHALKGSSANGLAPQYTAANTAAREHLTLLGRMQDKLRSVAALAGAYAGYKIAHRAPEVLKDYGHYEMEERYQGIVGKYNTDERAHLAKQRSDEARAHGYALEDTLKGQDVFARLQYNAAIAEQGAHWANRYGRAVNQSSELSAEQLEAGTFSYGVEVKTLDDAKREFKRTADLLTVMVKESKVSAQGAGDFWRYAGAPAHAANISREQAGAVAMTLSRVGIQGEEAGVAMRQWAARIIAPTAKGRAAAESAGMPVDKYASHGTLDVESANRAMEMEFGSGIGAKGRAYLRKRFDNIDNEQNPDKIVDSAKEYSKAVVEALRKDNANLSKKDEQAAARAAQRDYTYKSEGVRGGEFLHDELTKMNDQQRVAFNGDKQGMRLNQLAQHVNEFDENAKRLADGVGRAEQIAHEREDGFGFALQRLTASVDNAAKNLARAFEPAMTPLTNFGLKLVNLLDDLPDSTKIAASVAGVVGIGSAAVRSALAVTELAGAATTAAAALNAIATKGIPSALPGGPGTTTAPGGGVNPIVGTAGWMLGAWAMSEGAMALWREYTHPEEHKKTIEWLDKLPKPEETGEGGAGFKATAFDRGVASVWKSFNTAPTTDEYGQPFPVGPQKQFAGGEGIGLTTVQGEVTGQADVNLRVTAEPSQWFIARIQGIERSIVRLSGRLGGDKVGTGMSGDNGAQPSYSGSLGHQFTY